MRWKRMKRGLSKQADEWELEVKLPKIKEVLPNLSCQTNKQNAKLKNI